MPRYFRFHKGREYGLTTLELSGPEIDVHIKILSTLGKRERRSLVRAFLSQIRPWASYFTRSTLDHSSDGLIRDRRSRERGLEEFESASVDTLEGAVGFEIRMQRLKQGISQTRLAEQVGIRRPHLSDLERGLYLPNLRTLVALEQALRAPLLNTAVVRCTRQSPSHLPEEPRAVNP